MSAPRVTSDEPASSDRSRNSTTPSDADASISRLRQELVKAQLVVLELNDRVLQRETDRADAISLLGQAELVLEQKTGHIMELDRVLNQRIRNLEDERANVERQLHESQAAEQRVTAESKNVIDDLVHKLDQTNQDLGRAHGLAGQYLAEVNQLKQDVATSENLLSTARGELAEKQAMLASAQAECTSLHAQLQARDESLQKLHSEQTRISAESAKIRQELSLVQSSWVWRWSAPLRKIFGPRE